MEEFQRKILERLEEIENNQVEIITQFNELKNLGLENAKETARKIDHLETLTEHIDSRVTDEKVKMRDFLRKSLLENVKFVQVGLLGSLSVTFYNVNFCHVTTFSLVIGPFPCPSTVF